MKFVTVQTITPNTDDQRNVTLSLGKDNRVYLLGNLLHNTTIIVDQELVNNLQKLVNAQVIAEYLGESS